jgi:hypothetical protein
MQITFSKEEFVAMLATLWGIPLGLADLVFDFDEMTGDVRTFTITGMDAKSLSKIGAVTSGSPPKTRVPVMFESNRNVVVPPIPVTHNEVVDSDEDQDELDDIIRKSHELMLQGQPPPAPDDPNANELLMYPGASAEFPVEFANRSLGK